MHSLSTLSHSPGRSRWPGRTGCAMLLLVFGLLAGLPARASAADLTDLLSSVFRIHVVSQDPDYTVPWDPGSMVSAWGTGFLIAGNRILTNAHVASNARFITVTRDGAAGRYEARVLYIANDCDLALLVVRDAAFFKGLTPMTFGGIPKLDSTVTVLGYPIGGDRLSVTRGVVSRIDYQIYTHSGIDSHLAIQIDAAINPGNSGGPVVQDGVVVGVAFQGYNGSVAQNVGYMIPTTVIHHFLADIVDGRYDQYPDLGVECFPLVNAAERRALDLPDNETGVMVTEVYSAGAGAGKLKTGDVLMAIDGHKVFCDGRVELDGNRVMLHEVVERKFNGDSVRLDILRDGRPLAVTLRLNSPWPFRMLALHYDVRPRYVIFGGLLFQPLTSEYMEATNTHNVSLLYYYSQYIEGNLYKERPEIVVLSRLLPDPVNRYLSGFIPSIVDRINGRRIHTLEDVAAAFHRPVPFYVIRLIGNHEPIVLERAAVEAARKRILARYGIVEESYLGDSIVPASVRERLDAADRKAAKSAAHEN